jgi:hypothetical protein
MYKQLEEELIRVFGIPKVLMEPFGYGNELMALHCEVTDVKTKNNNEMLYYTIDGILYLASERGKLEAGYFRKKNTMRNVKSRITLARNESRVTYGDIGALFDVISQPFNYVSEEEFDTNREHCEGIIIEEKIND